MGPSLLLGLRESTRFGVEEREDAAPAADLVCLPWLLGTSHGFPEELRAGSTQRQGSILGSDDQPHAAAPWEARGTLYPKGIPCSISSQLPAWYWESKMGEQGLRVWVVTWVCRLLPPISGLCSAIPLPSEHHRLSEEFRISFHCTTRGSPTPAPLNTRLWDWWCMETSPPRL